MAAAYQDLFLEQGADFNTQLTLNDNSGAPYNLTGYSVESEAKLSYYSTNPSIIFNAAVSDANNGIIQLSANNHVTSNVYAGAMNKLVYDVIITDTNLGTITRVLEGVVYVSPSVSR